MEEAYSDMNLGSNSTQDNETSIKRLNMAVLGKVLWTWFSSEVNAKQATSLSPVSLISSNAISRFFCHGVIIVVVVDIVVVVVVLCCNVVNFLLLLHKSLFSSSSEIKFRLEVAADIQWRISWHSRPNISSKPVMPAMPAMPVMPCQLPVARPRFVASDKSWKVTWSHPIQALPA